VSGMESLLRRLEEREATARDQVERLRAQITSLSARLAAEEDTLSRLAITRQTVLTVLGDDDTPDAGVATPPVATPPVAADDAAPGACTSLPDRQPAGQSGWPVWLVWALAVAGRRASVRITTRFRFDIRKP
jgi:hypothetical protein